MARLSGRGSCGEIVVLLCSVVEVSEGLVDRKQRVFV